MPLARDGKTLSGREQGPAQPPTTGLGPSPVSSALSLVGLVLLLGCAHAPVEVDAPGVAPAVREQLGSLGIMHVGTPTFQASWKPARGAWEGADRGVSGLFSEGWRVSGDPSQIILLPVIVLGAAITGAIVAPSDAAVTAAEHALDDAIADPGLSRSLRDGLQAGAQGCTGGPVATLPDAETPPAGDRAQPAAVVPEVDTILEVGAPDVWLLPDDGPINPSLKLVVRVTTRVRHAESGETLHTVSTKYVGDAKTFTAWGADGARAFRAAVEQAGAPIARHILGQVFGELGTEGGCLRL